MKVSMHSQDRQLDEVIVVAYGEQKKSSFTGSAGVVDAPKNFSRAFKAYFGMTPKEYRNGKVLEKG